MAVEMPIERWVIRLEENAIFDEEKAKEGFKNLIEAMGWSWTSEPEIVHKYDIDYDKHLYMIDGRYVAVHNVSGLYPNHITNIVFKDNGVHPSPPL